MVSALKCADQSETERSLNLKHRYRQKPSQTVKGHEVDERCMSFARCKEKAAASSV